MIRFLLVFCLFISSVASADNVSLAFDEADDKNWSAAMFAAKQSGERDLVTYIQWRQLRDSSQRLNADQYLNFLEQYPRWPERDTILLRAAEMIALEGLRSSNVSRWEKLDHGDQSLLEKAWIDGSFSADEQAQILSNFRGKISDRMIERRVDRLLGDRETRSASSLLNFCSKSCRAVAEARIAFITRSSSAGAKRRKLSNAQQRSEGLLFDRITYHHKRKERARAEELLKLAPASLKDGNKWWKYWNYYAREALQQGRTRDALAILSPVKEATKGSMAQIFWLRGWIQMQFLGNTSEAYKDFYTFYHNVGTPISYARGAYWAGLAAKKNGNSTIATNWFKQAADHPATFFGQMARMQIDRSANVSLSKSRISAEPSSGLREQRGLLKLFAHYGQDYSFESFLMNLALTDSDDNALVALGDTARKLGYPHLSVRIGKKYYGTKQEWVQPVIHPVLDIPRGLAADPALVLAISRQESEFNPRAKSSADARGLMQLLPSTARLVARQQGISSSTNMLYEPKHNMKLGSHYIADLIHRFDGHLPLAIAGYNAGPHRVDQWLKRFGPFPDDLEGQLKWLEQIPFSETRNYVQRVLENLQVYRSLLGKDDSLNQKRMFGR